MLQREEAYKIAQKCAQFLKERFNVKNVYIFGSVIGDGIWHKRSDIDIAVEGLSNKDYIRALFDIYDLLPPGLNLDLIKLETAPIKLKKRIINTGNQNGDTEVSENNIDRLKWQIESEIDNLERISIEINEFLKYISEPIPEEMVLRSIGSCIHDFYNGIEKIFERIIVTFDGEIPAGENWHRLLLEQMEVATHSRPAVINRELLLILLDYLKFRHLFRHIYGENLDWEKLHNLAIKVSDILGEFKEQINLFLSSIKKT